jgi:hypothetical protein
MSKPTRTTNPLHFEDLDPRRFEDLALALVYRLRNWEDIHHDGRTGSDDGVDIRAIERLVDGSLRHWFVQCKRYQSFASSHAKTVVDEALAKASEPPNILLLVLGCDVTLTTRTDYETYAAMKGVETVILWTSAKLEAMLYAEHTDLLFSFFGVSLARIERTRENNVKRGLTIKRKLTRLIPQGKVPNLIIRSIDDEAYPNADAAPNGRISSWFQVEFGGHYHNGIGVIINIKMIIIDRETGKWSIIDDSEPQIRAANFKYEEVIDTTHYELVKVFTIGRIPFRNIFEIDEEGDEHYPFIHLYCRYADAGMPYEVILQREVEGHREFFPEHQFPFAERKQLS